MMRPKLTFSSGFFTVNLRRELRLALLAAMETCWAFAVFVFLATLMQTVYPLTPLPFFFAYWLALAIGRILPGSQRMWLVLQIASVAIAFLTVAAVARVEIYPDLNWSDATWLPRLAINLFSITDGFAVEHVVSAGVIYVFIRGLQFAQRPLTLWFVGYQFRLGIVVFFGLFFVAALVKSSAPLSDPAPWLLTYFFLSLVAIALARIDEMNNEIKLSSRWLVTLMAAVALVLFLGVGLVQVFTLDLAQAILGLFAPVGWLLSLVLIAVSIPFGYVLQWLIDILRPLFQSMGLLFDNLQASPLGDLMKTAQEMGNSPLDPTFITFVKTIGVLIVFLLVGYWIASALNRRMNKIESAEYARELIDDDEAEERKPREAKKKSAVHPRAHNPSAEIIRRIYATLVACATHSGLPRRIAETPYDFEPRLAQHWAESTEDIRAITEAYVSVHYGEQATTDEMANNVRIAWKRIEERIKRKEG